MTKIRIKYAINGWVILVNGLYMKRSFQNDISFTDLKSCATEWESVKSIRDFWTMYMHIATSVRSKIN
jgi:hypothetical protein